MRSELPSESLQELVQAAKSAAARAYNPYSRFSVGAAIRTKSGRIFAGCNIENASYSVTLCAERVAGSQAVLAGEFEWECLVVLSPTRVSLCGVCRQFCFEFAPKLEVWIGGLEESAELKGPIQIQELLPSGMTLEPKGKNE